MKNMTLKNIAMACGGSLICNAAIEEKEVQGVVLDSRQIERDFLFIATKGERVDGHAYIGQVMKQGALCVVCEIAPEETDIAAYILVEDSFVALRDIAEYYRSTLLIQMVGITGSVGKTSTKEFVAGVLSQKYKVLKTSGNFNNEVGVPLTILQIREEHEVAVLEMGINHFGEMHRLSKMVRPDICVLTNIGQCHLEFLGSREGILKAKSEIFDYMKDDGEVCLNGDDTMLQTIKEVRGKEPLYFGLSDINEIYATDIVNRGLLGSDCTIHTENTAFKVSVPLSGQHMIYNTLAATAVGKLLELTDEEIVLGIASVKALSGRNNVIQTKDYLVIDDCYNANPISMKAAIDTLQTAEGRKVAILGNMGELGETAGKLHEEVGEYCVQKHIDLLICIGEDAAAMKQGAKRAAEQMKGEIEIIWFAAKESMLDELPALLHRGDTILVKASHFMGFDTIIQALCS